MVTLSDRRVAVRDSSVSLDSVLWYVADVYASRDYYPFGMMQGGRNLSVGGYRYGFNGKEMDEEGMGGGGSTYDYGFRIYNPQIGKFLSVDPLSPDYPMLTPYQFAHNSPIWMIDIDGLEGTPYNAVPKWFKWIVNTSDDIEEYFYVNHSMGEVYAMMVDKYWDDIKNDPDHKWYRPKEFYKIVAYVGPYMDEVNEAVTYTALDDVVVLITGKHFDGEKATSSDKFTAFIFSPLPVSGSAGKKFTMELIGYFLSKGDNVIRLGKESAQQIFRLADGTLDYKRLQHGFYKHADDINEFKGVNWNHSTVAKKWEEFNANIIENAEFTFLNKLGEDDVVGFYKNIDGQDIATYLYKKGDKAGQYATTVVLTENAKMKFGIK